MPSIIVLPQGTYPIGTRTLGPASLAQGISNVLLELDGTAMTDPALALTIQLDLSLNNGTTWASDAPGPATNPFPVTLTVNGGALNRQGGPLAIYPLSVTGMPSPTSTTRRIKAVITIAGQALTTQGTLTTS